MFLFSRLFLHDFLNNPRQALETLKERRSRFAFPIIKFIIFWRMVFSEYFLNHCITRASALAYVLLLTLIPLLAAIAIMAASIMDIHPKEVESLLTHFLPFAPATVLEYISRFFSNAKKLRGIGIFAFIIVSVGLFGLVEESLNTIWKVVHSRSFFIRLRSFTMVMVYSPVLFFASFKLRGSGWLDLMPGYLFLLDVIPFLLMVLAFTMLLWLVPNIKVPFRSAFIGGVIAGGLFEFERHWFHQYVHFSLQTQNIFGTFGVLLFFLISLFLVSLFTLFGAQVAYVHQYFHPLLRAKTRWDRRVGDYKTYFALRIMIDAVASFALRKKPPSLQYLMKKYEMTESQAHGVVTSLINAGYLHAINGKDAYAPARDFMKTPVMEVIGSIEDENRKIPVTPNDFTKDYCARLIASVKTRKGPSEAGELLFERLIAEIDKGENKYRQAANGL
jgi:membrane protein